MIHEPKIRAVSWIPTLAVIGGGASGLFAAISAAEALRAEGRQARIRVYDANREPAKKILVSGNGRCNLSNAALSAERYPGADARLLQTVFDRFSNDDMIAWLRSHGFYTKTDAAGRIYPRSNQAASVRDFLLQLCADMGVSLYAEHTINSIKKDTHGFLLNRSERADRVILACGSAAAPRNGGRDSLSLASSLGVKPKPFIPALTSLHVRGFSKYQLKGLRAEGEISVLREGAALMLDRGELQYTEAGISGIPAMQVSVAAGKLLNTGERVFAQIDSLPEFTEAELRDLLAARTFAAPHASVFSTLNGLFPQRLSAFFMKSCGVERNAELASLPPESTSRLCGAIKRSRYQIDAVGGFADAQAAAGGIPADELDFDTMELLKCRGCHVCGELADVVGMCGGYNLQWAWSSGYVAGVSAARGICL